jgi:hypothetical protein
VRGNPTNIQEIIDIQEIGNKESEADTAVFYSITSTQPGLLTLFTDLQDLLELISGTN